jgi:hypothetical protein
MRVPRAMPVGLHKIIKPFGGALKQFLFGVFLRKWYIYLGCTDLKGGVNYGLYS